MLALTVSIHAYTGAVTGNAFEKCDVAIFVSSCPANALLRLVNERCQLLSIRAGVTHVLGLSAALDASYNAKKGACLKSLDRKLHELDLKLLQLDQLPIDDDDDSRIALLDAERSSLLATACRIKLYIAAMIVNSIDDQFDFTIEAANATFAEDAAASSAIKGKDIAELATRKISYLIEVGETRIKDSCVAGWLYRGDALEPYLEKMLNAYLAEVTRTLAELFEVDLHLEVSPLELSALARNDAEDAQDIRSRRELLECFFSNHNRLHRTLSTILSPLGFAAVPPPTLSLSVDQTTLFNWFSSAAKEVFKLRLEVIFQKWKSGTESIHLPWKVNRVWNPKKIGKFDQTSIPEDCIAALLENLSLARVRVLPGSEEFASLIVNINANSEILFVESLNAM